MIRYLLAALVASLTLPLHAEIPIKIYAQELVDRVVAKNPDLLVIVMHVTPPGAKDNIIIASNIGRIGKLGDEDDMRVINTGKTNLEVAHGGERFEVELVLQDMTGETIGALGLVWPYTAGQDKTAFAKKAERIRDDLARHTLNVANLMDPFPFERNATTKTHAQKLVERTAAKHPEATLIAIRSYAGKELIVLGSTFGRHGKKADEDDMKVVDSGAPVGHSTPGGKRYSAAVPLHDAAGKTIGILTVGYAMKDGAEDKLLAAAVKLRDALANSIPSADKLVELDP